MREQQHRPHRQDLLPTENAKEFAKQLRRELSPPERLLWSRLKGQQLDGLKFRKQHPIGPWIADFYCHEAALMTEVDGPTHGGERKSLDADRDSWMMERRIGVLRFTGVEVFRNLVGVLQTIHQRARVRIASFAVAEERGASPSGLRRLGHLPRCAGEES